MRTKGRLSRFCTSIRQTIPFFLENKGNTKGSRTDSNIYTSSIPRERIYTVILLPNMVDRSERYSLNEGPKTTIIRDERTHYIIRA